MIQYDIWEHDDKYIVNKTDNKKYHYNNHQDMRLLTDCLNKLINENYTLNDDYESLKITKNIIREKLKDYQRIVAKYNFLSSTELEWLLDNVFKKN